MSTNLNIKQLDYCRNYAALGSETRGDKAASALAAGYSDNCLRAAIYKLNDNKKVQAEIERICDKQIDKYASAVMTNLKENRELAKKKGDIASMNRSDELIGKALGIFKADEEQTGIEQKELTEFQQRELDEFIAWKHARMLGIENPKILAFEDERIRKGGG